MVPVSTGGLFSCNHRSWYLTYTGSVRSVNCVAKLRLEVPDKLNVGLGMDVLKVGLQDDLGKKALIDHCLSSPCWRSGDR
jgi:hypothetical protein